MFWLRSQILPKDSQACPNHSHFSHLHLWIAGLCSYFKPPLFFFSLCHYQATLTLVTRSRSGNPQIWNAVAFLLILLHLFTFFFSGVNLHPHFSSCPFSSPRLFFLEYRRGRRDGKPEGQGQQSQAQLWHSTALPTCCWAGGSGSEGCTVPLSPCQCFLHQPSPR